MTTPLGDKAKLLLAEVLELPLEQRATLASELLASLEEESEGDEGAGVTNDVEQAWAVEIERRARAALAGEAAASDCDEFLDRLEARLRPAS